MPQPAQPPAATLKPRCLTPACVGRPKWKGLCDRCYRTAKRLVDAGSVTWEKLAEMGLANLGAAAGDPFLDAFNEKTKEQ